MLNIFDKQGYLDWQKINKLAKNCPFIFVVGGRGTGKTYGALLDVYNSGKPFIYIRRRREQYEVVSKPDTHPFKAHELEGVIPQLTTKPVAKGVTGIYKTEINEDDETVAEDTPIGFMSALSTFSNLRGMSFEEVEIIIFDEFIPEPHERLIKNEAQAFLNLYETVSRNRELKGRDPVKVLLLANANDIANPLYVELGLVKKAEEMMRKNQTVSIDEKRGLCLVYLDHSPISERKRHTALYKLTSNKDSEFNQMALENRFYQDESALIRSCKLNEYIPVVTVNGITIYKHKSEKNYYVSTHKTGTCREYGTSFAEKKRFMNHHMNLWMAYLRNNVIFEEYLCLVCFEQAFDSTK